MTTLLQKSEQKVIFEFTFTYTNFSANAELMMLAFVISFVQFPTSNSALYPSMQQEVGINSEVGASLAAIQSIYE